MTTESAKKAEDVFAMFFALVLARSCWDASGMHLGTLLLDSLFGPKEHYSDALTLDAVVHDTDALRLRGLASLDALLAAGRYASTPLLKDSIRRFKYGRDATLAPLFASMMASVVQKNKNLLVGNPVLCPVPLHWLRANHRGFNQSALLTEMLKKETGLMAEALLVRTKSTGHQAHRKRAERLVALTDVFSIREGANLPLSVLLIDDLSTTGATLEECAKTLKKHGVRHITGLVIAIG